MPAIFWDKLQDMSDVVKLDRLNNIVLLGDFNADDNTRNGDKLNIFTAINHFTSLVDEPTRITATTQTRRNRILTNVPNFVSKTGVLAPLLNNDHCTSVASISPTCRKYIYTFDVGLW
jgi:hypothetical protein